MKRKMLLISGLLIVALLVSTAAAEARGRFSFGFSFGFGFGAGYHPPHYYYPAYRPFYGYVHRDYYYRPYYPSPVVRYYVPYRYRTYGSYGSYGPRPGPRDRRYHEYVPRRYYRYR
jgi:hypothetical protein